MNEEKLVELLKEHFPSRQDHQALLQEMRGGFTDMKEHFNIVDEKLDNLKSSSNVLDTILEKHPSSEVRTYFQYCEKGDYLSFAI